ncbi:hypothetical protein EST38_g3658 [Candolleomyces aberdarensis]|uniref:Uncharacterized protein n=1 Tax=Candolleomyces aberdarensis TaxID=2316362 RepID=A0A4V1Q4I3_9AGAR|nr:hypothetical protein EST38_g3658 [Candolleomyces aberdarensis]
MILRSGCSESLRRLSFSGFLLVDQTPFHELLFLTPNVTHLNLPLLPSFDGLILYPNGLPSPILPNLKSLTVYNKGHLLFRKRIDAAGLMAMVRSRTVDLSSPVDGNLFQALEEVQISAENNRLPQLRSDWRLLESRELGTTSCSSLTDFATEIEESLRANCWQNAFGATMKQCRELDATMNKMEAIDLSRYSNIEVLIRKNVPYLFHKISKDDTPGAIPGDRLFQLQPRARKLCEKWKPFLLRDAPRSPFYWTLTEDNKCALLRYQPKTLGEDELWNYILTVSCLHSYDFAELTKLTIVFPYISQQFLPINPVLRINPHPASSYPGDGN